MNCETCDSQLLDLLYEELAPAQAEEMRSHLADCSDCSAAFARISEGMEFAMHLPMLEPSPAVQSAIMDMARSRISGVPQAATARPLEVGVEREVEAGLLERVVDWLRDFATGPQAAMATVMLLVMAIGVWYVPHGAPTAFEATGTTLMSPDPEGEAAPAIAMDQEELAELIEEPTELGGMPGTLEERREQGRSPARQRSRANRSAGRSSAMASSGRGGSNLDDLYASGAPPASPAPVASAPAPAAEPAPEPTMRRSRSAASADSLMADSAGPAESAQPRQAAARSSAARAQQADVAMDEEAAHGPDDDGATESAEGVARAMHQLANGQRGRNQCGDAVRHYESLLSRFPSYDRAPQAMVELADCYRRMGHYDQARRWLTRAQQNSSTSAIASRALRQVEADAANSGSRTAAPPAAATAAEAQ